MQRWLDKRLFVISLFTQVMVPRGKASWQYFPAFSTFLLLFFQLVTGAILAFLYTSMDGGKMSSKYPFLYSCHAITAHLIIVFAFLYLLRNLLTGTYRAPREIHWLTLIALFLLVWTTYCVGAILPVTESSAKTLKVFMSVLSSIPVAGSWILTTLGLENGMTEIARHRLFVVHCFILPMIINIVVLFYFWLSLAPKIFHRESS